MFWQLVSGKILSVFCLSAFGILYFNLMFMAGAPVGDVSVHRPRVFYAGSSAMHVKVRASDPKGLTLTKWPLPAKCGL